MPGVGDHQPSVVDQHPGREVHTPLGPAAAGRMPFGLAVGLAPHHVSRLLIGIGDAVPDHHPVITGVGHHQVVIVEKHPAGRIHPRHRR